MNNKMIILDSIDKVNNFVRKASQCKFEIDVTEGRFCVNGKSLLGVFSLNLLNPLTLHIYEEDEEKLAEHFKLFEEYFYNE